MKIVNAVWELRNLGVVCTEATVDSRDSGDAVMKQLKELPLGYQVVKVPVACVDVMNALQRANFFHIECSIKVEHGLEIKPPEGLFDRMVSVCDYEMIDEGEIERVSEEIRSDMFKTDRVRLDPKFNRNQAATRYVNWMLDEISQGGSVYEVRAKSKRIGFFLLRVGLNRIGYCALAGLYPSSNFPGFGNVLLHLLLVEAKKRSLLCISSNISSNNLAVFKNHIEQGFKVKDIHYVYVRHMS